MSTIAVPHIRTLPIHWGGRAFAVSQASSHSSVETPFVEPTVAVT